MKKTAQEQPEQTTKNADGLYKTLVNSEKNAKKARTDYEKKRQTFDEALKTDADKLTLHTLWSAVKIAKYTYKIKRVEFKLAKLTWKTATKADKKTAKPVAPSAPAEEQKAE